LDDDEELQEMGPRRDEGSQGHHGIGASAAGGRGPKVAFASRST
jgi:hypothetical protein